MQSGRRSWSLLSVHGLVFAALAQQPALSQATLATQVGYSQRRVAEVLADLERLGYVSHTRQGHQNQYLPVCDARLQDRMLPGLTVADLVRMLAGGRTSRGRGAGQRSMP